MKKLQFKVSINAPVARIYDFMLGINSKSTYEQWTSLFNPTSTYEGNWDKGNKILFVGGTSTIETEDYAIPLQLGAERTYNVNLQADVANQVLTRPAQTLEPQSALPSRLIFLDHLGARNVRGLQVGRALNAVERQCERGGQNAD